MREIIKNTWETYLQFKGVGMHLGLYFAAVLFLNILSKSKKEKENSSLLSGHSLLFWGIFFLPGYGEGYYRLLHWRQCVLEDVLDPSIPHCDCVCICPFLKAGAYYMEKVWAGSLHGGSHYGDWDAGLHAGKF